MPELYTYVYDADACACFYRFTEGKFECFDGLLFNDAHRPFKNTLCITEDEHVAIYEHNETCEPAAGPDETGEGDNTTGGGDETSGEGDNTTGSGGETTVSVIDNE